MKEENTEKKESTPPENQRKSNFSIRWSDIGSDGEPLISNYERMFNIDLTSDDVQVKQLTMQVLIEDIKDGKQNKVDIILFKKSNYDFYFDNSKIIAKKNDVLVDYFRPNLYMNPNVALVGSSRKILDKPYGDEIDSYDEVMRFNRAPVYGFETYVGHKTTFRVANCHVFSNQEAPGYSIQPQYFIKGLRHTKILMIDHSVPTFDQIKEHTHDNCSVYSFFSEDHTFDARAKASPWRSTRPEDIDPKDPNNNHKKLTKRYKPWLKSQTSLGMTTIFLLINSDIKPHLFGFDLDVYDHNHYWENRPPPSVVHHVETEKKLLKKLIEEGKVIYHE